MERTLPLLASRRLVFRLAAGATLASAVASPAFANDAAADLIAATAQQVIDIIKATQGAARQAAIKQVLQTRFDLPYMAQVALGTHWAKSTPEQQERNMLNERARKKRKKEEAAAQTREDIPKTSPDASCPPCGLPRTANKGGQEGRFKGGGTTQKREHPEYDPNNNLAMLLTQAFNQTLGGPAGRLDPDSPG